MMNKAFVLVVAGLLSFPFPPGVQAEGSCDLPDDNRCELWSTTWDSGLNETPKGAHRERPNDLASHEKWLYTVGESHDGADASDAFILKTEATSGDLVWAKRFSESSRRRPFATAASVAVTPDGSTLYVSGTRRYDYRGHGDIFLAAFSARTGDRLWARAVHKGRAHGVEAEVVSDNQGVYVTGSGRYEDSRRQVITARYSSEGQRIWKRNYGAADTHEYPSDLATDGSRVFVAGMRRVTRRDYDHVTIAYDPKGRLLWEFVSQDDVPGYTYGAELRYEDDRVYLFGTAQVLDQSGGATTSGMYSLDASTGTVLWSDVVASPMTGFVSAPNLTLSPDGEIAYAVGLSGTPAADHFEEFVVRAYDSASGKVLWTSTYDPAVGDVYVTDAVARDEGVIVGAIFMPGSGRDMLTLAFSREAGAVEWSARHNPSDLANAEVNGGTMGLGPNDIVIHAGDVYSGLADNGGYRRNDVSSLPTSEGLSSFDRRLPYRRWVVARP